MFTEEAGGMFSPLDTQYCLSAIADMLKITPVNQNMKIKKIASLLWILAKIFKL